MSDNDQELSHQELFKLVLEQRKQLEETLKELGEFRSYVGSKMVPLEEKIKSKNPHTRSCTSSSSTRGRS